MGAEPIEGRDAVIRARLADAVGRSASQGKEERAQSAIWAAVALSMGMGVVPFGINIGWFFAVSTGLILYLGELYGYTYTKEQAAALLRELFRLDAQRAITKRSRFPARVARSSCDRVGVERRPGPRGVAAI
jgi:hypothetical protein